jgi:16S rRNA (cytosine1402-N4)-methyltransferase
LKNIYHKPVLRDKIVEYLVTDKAGIYLDATIGTGGHAEAILEELNERGKLLGIDKDENSLGIAQRRLRRFGKKVRCFHQSYSLIPELLNNLKIDKIKGIVMDLGLSSYQLERPERGFSYSTDGPLDMRFDKREDKSAFEVVNKYPLEKLIRIFREYGEERFSKRIAQAIVQNRKVKRIENTRELRDITTSILKTKDDVKTLSRIFQALRIEVNDELAELEKGLENGIKALSTGGRLCVISYHSLEDRIVKHKFAQLSKGCICPPEFPVCVCGGKKVLKVLTRKPVMPEEKEIKENPKARSAKLRAAEKVV